MRRFFSFRRMLSVTAVVVGVQMLPLTAAGASHTRKHRGTVVTTTTSTTAPPTTTSTTVPPPTAPTTTAPPTTTSTAVPPPTTSATAKIGLSYGDTLPNATAADLAATLDDAVAVGASWIRVDLSWDRIQPVSASLFDWSSFDRTVAAAGARRLSVLPIIAYTPAWARPAGCSTPKCAPSDASQYAEFASAAARRYAPQGVHAWEIWNEPNLQMFWQPAPSAAQYVSLLRTTAQALRAADPSATVISGGLSPAATVNGNIAQLEFLTAFSQLGGAALVDAVGYHPYSYPVLPGYNANWNAWAQIETTTTSFRSVLASYGAADKPLWLTEYGAPTNGPGAGATMADLNMANSPDHVDEALQAQMATDSVALAKNSTFIGALFWYSYRDLGTDPSTIENFFGLRRRDGTAKPAWSALRQAIIAG